MENEDLQEPQEIETSEQESQEPVGEEALEQDLPFEAINIVPALRKLGETDEKYKTFIEVTVPNKVCEEFKEDWDSCAKWRENRKIRNKLIFGDLDPKSFPWENCANGHLPIMLKSILRSSTRIYSELIKDNNVFADCVVIGEEEQSRAMTLFMNQQFTKGIPDFKAEIRRGLFEFIAHGEPVYDSYYDVSTGKFRHELLGCEEFVFPYVWKSTAVDMSDIPRKTKILRKYKRELKKLEKAGVYSGISEMLKKRCDGDTSQTTDNTLSFVVKDVMDKFEGKAREDMKSDSPLTILEYHGWLEFPGEEDERPVVIAVEYSTGTVIGMYTRETEDMLDLARFQKQTMEFEEYVQAVQMFTETSMQERAVHDVLMSDAVPNDEELALREAITGQPITPPDRPEWMEVGEDGIPRPPKGVKMVTIERFSKRACIENPEGSLGVGFGTLLQPFNEAADTMLNQFVDSATRANTSALIVDDNMFPAGVTNIEPGKVIRVKNFNAASIKERIHELTSQPANAQLAQIAQSMSGEADEISSAPSVFSGEKEGSETYRGQAGRIEQAMKQQSVIAGNFVELLTNLVKNQARLNSQFLPEHSSVKLLDPRTKEYVEVEVTREMFLDDFDTTFTADLRFASQAQRIAEADDVLGMLTKGIPPELAPKLLKPQILAAAVRKCLKARGQEDLLQYVNTDEEVAMAFAPPPMPPGLPGMPPGMPPGMEGAPAPGGAPPPSIPSGQPNAVPGEQVSSARPPEGSPVEAGAGQ